jgi:hypothetical protein
MQNDELSQLIFLLAVSTQFEFMHFQSIYAIEISANAFHIISPEVGLKQIKTIFI